MIQAVLSTSMCQPRERENVCEDFLATVNKVTESGPNRIGVMWGLCGLMRTEQSFGTPLELDYYRADM